MKISHSFNLFLLALFLCMTMTLSGCALNNGDISEIPGMKVWLDSNEGLYKPAGYVTSWENLADEDHPFTATSSTAISPSSSNYGYPITNPSLYFNTTACPMQSPVVLDNATFTIVFAGQANDNNYLITIPTKTLGDISLYWNNTYLTADNTLFTNSFTNIATSSTLFFAIRFTHKSNNMTLYAVNLTDSIKSQYNYYTSGNPTTPSAYIKIGSGICMVSDVFIFDYALSDSEIENVKSIIRKKYGF